MSVLEARDLVVEFRQRGGGTLRAVDHVSFALEKGETLALVGESGSGKSTVVRTLAQLQRVPAGAVLLDGQPAGRAARGGPPRLPQAGPPDLPGPVRVAEPDAHRALPPGPAAAAAAPGHQPVP